MKLSKTTAHATLALAFLAGRVDAGPTQARHVADFLGVPTESALKVLQALTRAQFLRSQLGRGGGYQLDRSPQSITLLNVVEAIDGPIRAQLPVPGSEPGAASDVLEEACRQAAHSLRHELSRYSIKDVAMSLSPAPEAAA